MNIVTPYARLMDVPGDEVDDDAAAIGWSAMFLCSAVRALEDQRGNGRRD